MTLKMQTSEIILNLKKLNYKDLIIFLIPFTIFLFYLHIYNPGILTVDSFAQLHQIATGEFGNWHPFFHTFIEMICIAIYPSPASVGFLQITTFSAIWMIICKYFRSDDVGLKNKSFILQFIVTLIISVIPINAIYSITLWKDILFSYFILFLSFLVKVLLDKKGDVDFGFIVLMSILMAFISQIRPNGIYIVLILLIVFALYLFKKNENKKISLSLPALTIIFILLIASLNVAYDVQDDQKDAVFAKVAHMLSDYDMNLDLKNEDSAKIHEMINETAIEQYYKPTYSDDIWVHSNEQVYNNGKSTYIGMAISYSLQNPIYFLEYMFKSSPMVWDLTRDNDWAGNVYKTDINNANRFFYASQKDTPAAGYDGVMATNSKTNEYLQLNGLVYQVKDNIITDTLFESPALYMYLAIILMIGIQFITKSKDIYLVYLPNLLNIIIVFVSTPIQDTRYLYPNILLVYLLIIILIETYLCKNPKSADPIYNKNNDKKLNSKFKNNNKTFQDSRIQNKETPEEMEARIRAKILKELEESKK